MSGLSSCLFVFVPSVQKKMKYLVFLISIQIVYSIDPVVIIEETNPPTKVNPLGQKYVVVQKNSDAYFTCVVHNKRLDDNVQWIGIPPVVNAPPVHISTGPDNKDPTRYQIDIPSALSWRLKIKKIQVSNEMKYVCQVKIGEQKYAKDERFLVVTIPPQIDDLETSSDMTVSQGDPVSLRCNATGRPFPLIKWQKLAGGLLPSGGIEHKDYVLNFGDAKPEYRGKYKCTARNDQGMAQRIVTLTVRFAPIATAYNSIVKQKPGYRKELRCIFQANPIPTKSQVMWSKNGVPLPDDGNFKVTYIEGASDRVTSKLTIYRVTSENFGYYECEASNAEGSGSTQIELQSSPFPTKDITGKINSAGILTFSMGTILMVLGTCLLL